MTAPAKMPMVGGGVLVGAVSSYDHKAVPPGGCRAMASGRLSEAGIGSQTHGSGGSGPGR